MALRWLTNLHHSERLQTSLPVVYGEPKTTDLYTVDELRRMGMRGVYTATGVDDCTDTHMEEAAP